MARPVKLGKSKTGTVSVKEKHVDERRFSLPNVDTHSSSSPPRRKSSFKSEDTQISLGDTPASRKTYHVSDNVGLKRAFWNSARSNLAKSKLERSPERPRDRLGQTFSCVRDAVRGVMQKACVTDVLQTFMQEKAAEHAVDSDSDTESYESGDEGLAHGECFTIKSIFADLTETNALDEGYYESLLKSAHNLQASLNKLLDLCNAQLASNGLIDDSLLKQCNDVISRIKALEEKLQREAANRAPASKLDEVRGVLDRLCQGVEMGMKDPLDAAVLHAFLCPADSARRVSGQSRKSASECDDFGEDDDVTYQSSSNNRRSSDARRNCFSGFESHGNDFFRRKSAEIVNAHRFKKKISVPRRHSLNMQDLQGQRRQALASGRATPENESLKLEVASLQIETASSMNSSQPPQITGDAVAKPLEQEKIIFESKGSATPDTDALYTSRSQRSPTTSETPSRPRLSPSDLMPPPPDKVLHADANSRNRIVGDLLDEIDDQCKVGCNKISVEAVCLSRTLQARARAGFGWRHRIGSNLCPYPQVVDSHCEELRDDNAASAGFAMGGPHLSPSVFRGIPARHHVRHNAFNDLRCL